MTSKTPDQSPQPSESDEQQLCTSCTTPNEPNTHFCVKCGAPLSSFATLAPFERLFAIGFIYREAADRPRKLIVVLGIWLIFGIAALFGLFVIMTSQGTDSVSTLAGAIIGGVVLLFSLVIIWKSTWNYLARKKTGDKVVPDQSPPTR